MSRKKVKELESEILNLNRELVAVKKNCQVVCECKARQRVGDLIVFRSTWYRQEGG